MRRRTRAHKAGLPPGTPIHIGERLLEQATVAFVEFSSNRLRTGPVGKPNDLVAELGEESVLWIDAVGLHDTELLQKIGQAFGIHALAVEDVANTEHRPKVEIDKDYIFVVAKTLALRDGDSFQADVGQISFLIGAQVLITFREGQSSLFEPVQERLMVEGSRLRSSGPDYLAYAFLDTIVDSYFHVIDKISDGIDALEESVLNQPDRGVPQRVHAMKRDLLLIHKAVWPLREMINALLRAENSFIQPGTRPFLRDLYDHIIQINETIEIFREMLSGLLEVHFANVNTRMGEVMKVLTLIATIFIPLTFLTGVYGMNFEYMPGLSSRWGFPITLLFMLGVSAGLLLYFRRKGWF
jgi:magnesium transporter